MNEWHGKPKHSEETCFSAALSITDATWLQQGSNPGGCDGKPAADRVSYVAAEAVRGLWGCGRQHHLLSVTRRGWCGIPHDNQCGCRCRTERSVAVVHTMTEGEEMRMK
jgi:hypothetical protein